ncbi:hypothetical protein Bbelb_203240 [Branchiostoma belcheri]|nr:hypothetical protein Bbelb_203240 [Branchiostoma belcheri]
MTLPTNKPKKVLVATSELTLGSPCTGDALRNGSKTRITTCQGLSSPTPYSCLSIPEASALFLATVKAQLACDDRLACCQDQLTWDQGRSNQQAQSGRCQGVNMSNLCTDMKQTKLLEKSAQEARNEPAELWAEKHVINLSGHVDPCTGQGSSKQIRGGCGVSFLAAFSTNSSSNLPSPTSLELPHLSSVPVLTGMGTTVKTERGEQVTTRNRTRVVRLAVTNANHYTKRALNFARTCFGVRKYPLAASPSTSICMPSLLRESRTGNGYRCLTGVQSRLRRPGVPRQTSGRRRGVQVLLQADWCPAKAQADPFVLKGRLRFTENNFSAQTRFPPVPAQECCGSQHFYGEIPAGMRFGGGECTVRAAGLAVDPANEPN